METEPSAEKLDYKYIVFLPVIMLGVTSVTDLCLEFFEIWLDAAVDGDLATKYA